MSNSCGLGVYVGPKPGDPDNNSILRVIPAFGGIDVSWSYPTINPHAVAYTILYRARSSIFAESTQIAIVNSDFYYDKLDDDVVYYYWIKFMSVNGTEGDLIGPEHAQSRPRLLDYMEQLTSRIDNSFLGIALRAKLDELSWINTNLNAEIFDRESGQTSFAQALLDVQRGVAEAHTFITTERLSRVTANSAIAEQIDLLAVTLGNNVAAVDVTSRAWITELNGKIQSIGAMWTARVTVNGLIGGFGIYNDGTTVLAGFDVDLFFVGRTNADKRKPFLIENNQVFMDEAFINKLSFLKLRSVDGSFVVENGRIRADLLDTKGLIIKDIYGNPLFGSGVNLDWSKISGIGKPANNADVTSQNTAAGITGQGTLATKNDVRIGSTVKFPDGTTMNTGDFVNRLSRINSGNISTYIDGAAITSAYIGYAAIGSAQIGELTVDTIHVKNGAISNLVGASGYTTIPEVWIYLNVPGAILVTAWLNTQLSYGTGQEYVTLVCGNNTQTVPINSAGMTVAIGLFYMPAGTYRITGSYSFINGFGITALETGITGLGMKK